ncbi:MAG: hypothetical protein NTY15_04245 [Planctomycetota bacterium]|nr:hypothetical protein [Planctomycetota bacterium]
MKKLVGLFLWFCAATVLAQVCIIGMAAFKGTVNRQTIAQVIGLLNGIDIQGQRLKQAMVSARNTPTPTLEEIRDAKVSAELQLSSRERSLDRQQSQLLDQQRELQKKIADFDERRLQFDVKLEKIRSGSQVDNLKEMQKILENMEPLEAKKQLTLMLEKKELSDVVSILQGFPPDKQKKVLAEFTEAKDASMLSEVLQQIRKAETVSEVDNALKPKKP